MLAATAALVRKDLVQSARNPGFFIIGIMLPVFFTLLYSFIVQAATTNPIYITKESEGPATERLVRIMEQQSSADGKAWRVVTTDPQRAERAFDSGEAMGIVRIPETFEQDVRAGEATVGLGVYNINSDISKNLRLRLTNAMMSFQGEVDPQHQVDVRETPHWDEEMGFAGYMGASLLMFALIYGGMVNTGNLIAREWEEGTAKNVVLSPKGFWPLVFGKWMATLLQSLVTMVLVLLTLRFALPYPIGNLGPGTWLPIVMLFFYGAALGALLGVLLRRSLPLVPIAAVVSLVHFLLVGLESYMRGYAHFGFVEWLWYGVRWWPVGPVTDQIRFNAEGISPVYGVDHYMLWMVGIVVALTVGAVAVLRRKLTFAQGQ
ncbi:ABC transporter permease [Actinopolyspora halophila]|uniref:ABC transporter permease n=1 Tax=Actinopolyspora halophila TaxID=1850 RepID=UPI00037B0865|nr:ABC transporter permease [Actinopolyspora halophila]